MKKHSIILLSTLLPTIFCSPPPQSSVYLAEPSRNIFDTSLTALYVPLEKIKLSVVQEKDLAAMKKTNPIYLFAKKPLISQSSIRNDSFFVEMANTLAQYEVFQHYKAFQLKPDTVDTGQNGRISLQLPARCSRLTGDTVSFEKVSAFIKKTAEKYSVDLVVVPYECSVKESEIQKRGWRNDKYGKYYEKPSTVDAKALFHVQIWDKNGVLLYERKGTGSSERPVLYYALKQERPADQSVVDFSRNIFAPTLVRALGEACRNAFDGR